MHGSEMAEVAASTRAARTRRGRRAEGVGKGEASQESPLDGLSALEARAKHSRADTRPDEIEADHLRAQFELWFWICEQDNQRRAKEAVTELSQRRAARIERQAAVRGWFALAAQGLAIMITLAAVLGLTPAEVGELLRPVRYWP